MYPAGNLELLNAPEDQVTSFDTPNIFFANVGEQLAANTMKQLKKSETELSNMVTNTDTTLRESSL